MAFPTSTIVLALATCVPFGLAIKDTINGTGSAQADDDDLDEYADYDDSYERRAKAELENEKREEERKEQAEREMKEGIKALFARKAATLGEAFEGVKLGASEDVFDGTKPSTIKQAETVTKTKIAFDFQAGKLASISVRPRYSYDEDEVYSQCLLLRTELADAWGDPQITYDASSNTSRHWTNDTTSERVTMSDLDNQSCAITIEKFTTITAWFDPKAKDSVVPMWALGGPAKALVEHLGGSAYSSKDEIRWTTAGVGAGSGGTEMYAVIKNKKIVTITARAQTSSSSRDALAERLTELFGEPVDDAYDDWKWTKPQLQLVEQDDDFIMIVAGKPLPEPTDEDSE